MIFALITLLTALSLATVAGWFSIVGFMAIYAGAPMYALIMGVVVETAKLVTASWVYRNWKFADWKLKGPLIYFILALMTATSIGVFGFLSKAHLEQGAGTLDNSSKIEQLQYQIDREKAIIADNEKVTKQLDDTVNSFLGKDRADRALSVRRSQATQRRQLREDSAEAQKRIDALSSEKFKFESEIRKMELDVGPIRYIAELFYGVSDNATKNIESAVRIFTLLLVSTLDPLAVILLIAANHTLMRLRDEKKEKDKTPRERFFRNPFKKTEANKDGSSIFPRNDNTDKQRDDFSKDSKQDISGTGALVGETAVDVSISKTPLELLNEKENNLTFRDITSSGNITRNITDSENSDINTESYQVVEKTNKKEKEEILPVPINEEIFNQAGNKIVEQPQENADEEIVFKIGTGENISESSNIQGMDKTEGVVKIHATLGDNSEIQNKIQRSEGSIDEDEKSILEKFTPSNINVSSPAGIRTPTPTKVSHSVEESKTDEVSKVSEVKVPWAQQNEVLRELLGTEPHFVPKKLNEKEKAPNTNREEAVEATASETGRPNEITDKEVYPEMAPTGKTTAGVEEFHKKTSFSNSGDKYRKALSWITEFRRL